MRKRWFWVLYGIALVLAVSLSFRNIRAAEVPDKPSLTQVETPQTGSHPAPIIAAMILAFSGVAISLLVEEKNKRE